MEWFASHWLNSSGDSEVPAEQLKILDVGSCDVNGCYKSLFEGPRFDYTGLDVAQGPNVDIVPDSPYHWRTLDDDSFDVVISGQALEHIEFFWLTVAEMVRVTKQGGLLCIIAPRGFGEHRYPVDCYRFLADGMVALARYTNLEILHAHCDCRPNNDSVSPEWHLDQGEDSLLIARKPYAGRAQLVDIDHYQCRPADLEMLRSPLTPHAPVVPIEPSIFLQEIPAKSEGQDTPSAYRVHPKRTIPQKIGQRLRKAFGFLS